MPTLSRFPANSFNFLRWRSATNVNVSDLPVTELDPIDMGTVSPVLDTWYFGITQASDLTPAEILSQGTSVSSSAAGAVTVNWAQPTDLNVGSRGWVWFPNNVPIKTEYEDVSDSDNQGNIGSSTDLFNAPSSKTVNSVDGRFYIMNYLTLTKPFILS